MRGRPKKAIAPAGFHVCTRCRKIKPETEFRGKAVRMCHACHKADPHCLVNKQRRQRLLRREVLDRLNEQQF